MTPEEESGKNEVKDEKYAQLSSTELEDIDKTPHDMHTRSTSFIADQHNDSMDKFYVRAARKFIFVQECCKIAYCLFICVLLLGFCTLSWTSSPPATAYEFFDRGILIVAGVTLSRFFYEYIIAPIIILVKLNYIKDFE